MSEPEELILEGAHFATRLARDAWARYAAGQSPTSVQLASVRRRLELFLTALFGAAIPIAALEPPPPVTWLGRLARGRADARRTPPICATDGIRVYLAGTLDLAGSRDETLRMYRLLAVQQAARCARGSQRAFVRLRTPVTRDLFMLAEAEAVDRWVVEHAPGFADDVNRARSAALGARQTGRQRPLNDIERAARTLLAAKAGVATLELPPGAVADAVAAWAECSAPSYLDGSNYEPIAPVLYWGQVLDATALCASPWHSSGSKPADCPPRPPRVAEMRRRPRSRQAEDDEDDQGSGTWVIRADEPQESVEDAFGLQRPADRDQHADPDGLADSLSDLPAARVVRTPEPPREVLRSGDSLRVAARADAAPVSRTGIAYPEWDYRTQHYRHHGAIVRQPDPAAGDVAWVHAMLARDARLVRRVRTRFERLRPRPVRLFRQPDGADIDVAAYVTGAADRRAGVTADDRLYVATRPARRELAVALLLDVSASTDAWVSPSRRIVDVAKEAMLIVCEALDALGDAYALFAFSGESAEHVAVPSLKGFSEPSSLLVRRRIAALDANAYTRLGAPIRHVTAALCRQRATSRLLLLLSDGKPNDVDLYEGRYGLEDTRQAVAEAHRQGVTVFCLTIDREAPSYAGRIFGRSGFAVLHRPEQLPTVVVEVLRQLVRM
jgi:nitric oxide reductase NorD protein